MDPFTIALIATGVSGLIKGAGNIIQGQANKQELEQENEDLQRDYQYQIGQLVAQEEQFERDTEYKLTNIQEETAFQTDKLQREKSRTQGTILAQQAAAGIQGSSPDVYMGDLMGVYNNQLQYMTSTSNRQQSYIKESASAQRSQFADQRDYMKYQLNSGQDQISSAKTANTWNTILSTAGTVIGTGAQMMNMDHTQAMQDAQYGTNLSIMDWGY